ncbi:MAG: 5-carboxymethyl-2-hydroxymuconate Delta-isomerase [Burkholderiaceae bacterium]
MPHIIIEYSANIRQSMDLPGLIDTMHAAALSTGVFPPGGTRTRAAERTDYRIADGHPDNAFVHVMVRIGHGRDQATKQAAGETLFDALCAHLTMLSACSPLALSLQIEEIDPVLTYKQNNIHEYVKARKSGQGAQ